MLDWHSCQICYPLEIRILLLLLLLLFLSLDIDIECFIVQISKFCTSDASLVM